MTVDDVSIQQLEIHTDDRGLLAEIYRSDFLPPAIHPEMAYISATLPNVTRGPHEHIDQTDHFVFLGTSKFHVTLTDHNGGIKEFDAEVGAFLSVIVPPGVMHSYENIGSTLGFVVNMPNRLYKGYGRNGPIDEIRYENE